MLDVYTIILTTISTMLGAAISIITIVINQKMNKKEQKRAYFNNLITSNSKLFALIMKGAANKNNILYSELREELNNSNILPMLYGDLQREFIKLYAINGLNGNAYDNKREEIYDILCNIEELLEKYGEDVFG